MSQLKEKLFFKNINSRVYSEGFVFHCWIFIFCHNTKTTEAIIKGTMPKTMNFNFVCTSVSECLRKLENLWLWLMLAQTPHNFFVICKIFFLDLTTILGFIAVYWVYNVTHHKLAVLSSIFEVCLDLSAFILTAYNVAKF